MNTIKYLVVLAILFALSVFAMVPRQGGSLENALLQGDWQKVIALLEKDNARAQELVARLLMAHATLATNRNNDSLTLLLSVQEQADLKQWSEWTETLLRSHTQNPVALYLAADAKARVGQFPEAIDLFSKALEINNNFALAYNGRGVVRVLANDWDLAEVDFKLATDLTPDLANAHANRGTLGILREVSLFRGEDGQWQGEALEAFKKALQHDPQFALAYNGLGCLYFGSGDFDKAAKNFRLASKLSPALGVAEINQQFASAYAARLITVASVEKKPGTTLDSIIQQYPTVLKEQNQG